MSMVRGRKMKTQFIFIILFLLVIPLALAQNTDIGIKHVGYGKTPRYVKIIIGNTGDVPLTSIKVIIDGEEYQTKQVRLSPKKTISDTLYLSPGDHLIEVRTPEGAYNSLSITIPETEEKPTTIPKEEILFLKENKLYIGAIILIVILVVGIWLFTRKPELK